MEYILIGVVFVAVIGLFMFLGIRCLDERAYGSGWLWTILFAAYFVFGIAGIVYAYDQEEKACEAKGGQMMKVGESTFYINSGSVLIPSTSSEYACVKIPTE